MKCILIRILDPVIQIRYGQNSAGAIAYDAMKRTQLVEYLVMQVLVVPKVLLHHFLGQTRSIRQGELVLDEAEPAVRPCGGNGDQEPFENIQQELKGLGTDKRSDASATNTDQNCSQRPGWRGRTFHREPPHTAK